MKIIKIYDNEESIDRYTVYLSEISGLFYECFCMSDYPRSPTGVAMHSMGMLGPHNGNGKEIQLSDLPDDCQKTLAELGYTTEDDDTDIETVHLHQT